MTTHVRLRHRPVFERDAVLLARPAQHLAVEFLGVVEMNSGRKSPARPLPADPQLCKPSFFGQRGVSDAQPRCDRSGRIERDVKAGHHAAVHVDRQREPRPADRQALLIVDHDDIEFRVIDLDEVERSLGAVEHTGPRRKLIDRGPAMRPTTEAFARWNRHNPDLNRVGVRRTQLRFVAAARHFQRRRPDRPLLPREEVLADRLFDDLLNPGIQAALAPAALGLYGSSDESSPDARYARAQR
jgi:hypothetical protein